MTDTLSDHEIVTYQRVQGRLHGLRGGMPIQRRGPLTEALDKLSCIPFVSFGVYNDRSTHFEVGGSDAGTLGRPKIDVISRHSKPSAYGKGEETVMDETYRRGEEISGADITFKEDRFLRRRIAEVVAETLFVGRSAEIKLYKLVIYKKGGHFDWHMDSTHSKEHHATVLVALNTTWSGGHLVLRRNGVEMRESMKPRKVTAVAEEGPSTSLSAIAFYTDTEHKVEPITSGTRIVLQYDVEVKNNEMDVGRHDSILENVGQHHDIREAQQQLPVPVVDPAAVDETIAVLRRMFQSGKSEVGFALQYLYRKSSIKPEFLKGSDSLLYQALIKARVFNVSLHPVVLRETTDSDGSYNSINSKSSAYIFEHSGRKGRKKKSTFYISRSSAIERISSQDYIEYTGNEAQIGENTYFGGGMFVKARSRAKKTRS